MTRSLSGRTVVVVAVLFAVMNATGLLAVSRYRGLEPGLSTREEVERVLGLPVRNVSPAMVEYKPGTGTGPIYAEYRAGTTILERIEVHFSPPLQRQALLERLKLGSISQGSAADDEGHLVEYYGAESRTLAFTYTASNIDSGVRRLGYYSRQLFDRTVTSASAGTITGPTSRLPTPPPASGSYPAVELGSKTERRNMPGCRDLYYWAQTEQDVAKRTRDVARRQLMLDILIAAQQGDCEHANRQATLYRQRYK